MGRRSRRPRAALEPGVLHDRRWVMGKKWIAVTRELPPYEFCVLTFDGEMVWPGIFSRSHNIAGTSEWFDVDSANKKPIAVTHWMHMPNGPSANGAAHD